MNVMLSDMQIKIIKVVALGTASLIGYLLLWQALLNLFPWHPGGKTPMDFFHLFTHFLKLPLKTRWAVIITGIAPLACVGALCWHHAEQKRFSTLFGDSHWARLPEIKKMGLLDKGDIVIGWKGRHLLRAQLTSHLLVFAPSRSGKGVSQVIPNALTFKGSLLVIDIKQEIFEATSGYRDKHGQEVFLFSPANLSRQTHCYNPLDYVSSHPSRLIADLQSIIEILIPKTEQSSDPMWIEEARALCLGLLLWLKESGRTFTLGELNAIAKGTNLNETIRDVLNASIIADNLININPAAYMNLNNFLQKAEKEKSGVKSSLTSKLTLWDDPMIIASTSKSDFDLRQLREKPMSIYLGIPTNQLERLAPLMNLFVQQFLSMMTETLPNDKEPYRVLAILDEFCNLGRMEKLRQSLSFLAGYRVHLMPVIQTIGEFNSIYGKDSAETFFQNTDYKILYRQNSPMDKEFVSRLLGCRTMKARSKSRHQSMQSAQSLGTSDQWIERPLLSPDEVGNFHKKNAIAKISGHPPVKFKRIIYYEDPLFKERLLPPIIIPTVEPMFPTIQVKMTISSEPTDSSNQNDPNEEIGKISEIVEVMQCYQQVEGE